jgi:hypothetical protein
MLKAKIVTSLGLERPAGVSQKDWNLTQMEKVEFSLSKAAEALRACMPGFDQVL